MARRVLAIVAHPDDETLGCGGTLARHAAQGDEVSVLTFTDGVGSRVTGQAMVLRRRTHFGQALAQLGIRFEVPVEHNLCDLWSRDELLTPYGGWRHYGYKDQQLDVVPLSVLARSVTLFASEVKAEVIYTHWAGDLNQDHRAVAEAVLVATRPGSTSVRAVYACEVPSASEWMFGGLAFAPDTFVDLSGASDDAMSRKLNAWRCYEDEQRAAPHPRAQEKVVALGSLRGAQVGVKFAEAFMTLRRCVNYGDRL